MPIFQYECKRCDLIFERYQGKVEVANLYCPVCKGEVEKIPSPTGLIEIKGGII